jgi:hypothetical protein
MIVGKALALVVPPKRSSGSGGLVLSPDGA